MCFHTKNVEFQGCGATLSMPNDTISEGDNLRKANIDAIPSSEVCVGT